MLSSELLELAMQKWMSWAGVHASHRADYIRLKLFLTFKHHARLAQSVERETLKAYVISRLWVRPPRRAQFPSAVLFSCFSLLFSYFCFSLP